MTELKNLEQELGRFRARLWAAAGFVLGRCAIRIEPAFGLAAQRAGPAVLCRHSLPPFLHPSHNR